MSPTPSSSRTRTTTPQKHQTYDRRISKEIARLDPEIEDAIVPCIPVDVRSPPTRSSRTSPGATR